MSSHASPKSSPTPHTREERRRVLDAYSSGGDWRAVASHNGFPRTTAERLVRTGRVEDLPRGGARATKVTPEIKATLELWLDECCTYTLSTLGTMVMCEFNVLLSEATISPHLVGMFLRSNSALKAHIKQYLALMRDEMNRPRTQPTSSGPRISKTEARMQLLERAVHVSMPRITQVMVQRMKLHAVKFVVAAIRMEDMKYGE
ncbi:hypothetical protein PF004_g13242 [Phytophthora fragariae]|uniref:Uncharacterized protein n=1 Tax=Phytophthora fragariae TaxID=53985 RepID=A0A6G0NSV6_9STRA|nr:hypothetical protein PF004_g13242 [Phytophthora fragariae]